MKLTVLIPTYNRGDRLKLALESYLINKRPDIEFLICDNNSSDQTESIVSDYAANDGRIKYIKNSVNIGANRSIFRGLLNAKGEYIMFLADDDYISPDYIDEVLKIGNEHLNLGVIHSVFEHERVHSVYSKLGSTHFEASTVEAIEFAFSKSGSITGLTVKKSLIDFHKIKLDNKIYPQVRIASHIALAAGVYCINSESSYVLPNKFASDTVINIGTTRPSNYGIGERLEIMHEVISHSKLKKKVLHDVLIESLINYSINLFLRLYEENKEYGVQTLKEIMKLCDIRNSHWFIGRSLYLIFVDKRISFKYKFQVFGLLAARVNPYYILRAILIFSINFKKFKKRWSQKTKKP